MRFHPVILLPKNAPVFDLTQGIAESAIEEARFGIGRYNEKRRGVYTAPQYGGTRDIHMGIDLFAPAGTPVHAFADGQVLMLAYNGAALDYGYTIVTEHVVDGKPLYALFGHLNKRSIDLRKTGQTFQRGETLAWIGERHENGGWIPHLHFQLSLVKPASCDMPGAVSDAQREEALKIYPDPRLVLGTLY